MNGRKRMIIKALRVCSKLHLEKCDRITILALGYARYQEIIADNNRRAYMAFYGWV